MSFRQVGAVDLPGLTNEYNGTVRELNSQEVTKIFKDEQGTPVVILNKDGLKTTQPGSGIDVNSANDSQLTFNSARNTLKVVSSGTKTVNAVAGTTVVADVPISLGYTPVIIANVSTPGAPNLYTPVNYFLFVSTTTFTSISVAVEATNISFQVGLGPGSGASAGIYTFKYYLLQETAN